VGGRDNGVCEIANKEQRILITNGKDFDEIVFFKRTETDQTNQNYQG
jgi:hypothetical protein